MVYQYKPYLNYDIKTCWSKVKIQFARGYLFSFYFLGLDGLPIAFHWGLTADTMVKVCLVLGGKVLSTQL